MTQAENLRKRPLFTSALSKRMLIGAMIGLIVVGFFVIGAGAGNPEWPSNWRVKPLLLTPFLGAMTGLCFDMTEPLRQMNGWFGRAFWILSILGYFIGLWLSLVLG
jgi:ABC-type transport system involved in cytochrome c biogenesis permease subunit